ncbi:MAG: CCDC90 family protein [Methylovulum sp.]|jgi:biopolymer transport protein ExbB/TolQ|nr:CCDC90 family protein [Methylovulum sp.]MCF7998880.1 CCDC90 family protein [Methylovulum sp.]
MPTITFDTLKFVRKLESAGFSVNQAEAVADAFRDASGEAELATRRDIERLEAKIEARFERLEGEMKLNRWMLGIIVVAEVAPLLGKLFNM